MSENDNYKYYIQVPFDEKDEAKKLEFKWCKETKKWGSNDIKAYRKLTEIINRDKYFLNISFECEDKAKEMGCKWDSNEKKWFTTSVNSLVNKLRII